MYPGCRYSIRILDTGLLRAVLITWNDNVITATLISKSPLNAKTHQSTLVL